MKLKKWLLGLMTFAAMAVLCAVCAGAEEYSSGLWKYTPIGNGEAYITAYSGFDSNLNIPSKLDGYTISGIEREAFYNGKNVNKVKIPSTITYIGYHAFANSSITSIEIPSSVTEFGNGWNGYRTFENCDKLTTVIFNANSVPHAAFYDCNSLKTVTIGNSTTSIGDSAFEDCTSLVSVKFGNNIKTISHYAFTNTALKSISFPSSLKRLGYKSFSNTKLTSVSIPASVTEFLYDGTGWLSYNGYTFSDCNDLVSVTFNASAPVPPGCFADCESLKKVTIGNATTGIDSNAFGHCGSLKNVKIGENVRYIAAEAFCYTKSLETVIGGSSLTSIGDSAFEGSGLRNFLIPETVTSIGYHAFADSKLESVTIPSSVVNWEKFTNFCWAFYRCNSLTLKIGQASMPNDDLFRKAYGIKIYCIPGSEAEEYAKSNGISYSATLKSIKSTSIKLNKKNYNLKTGETLRLYPTVAPQNTTDRIEWISGNTDIATVDGAGIVTGVSEGTVAIQVKTTSGVSTTCVIEVSDSAITSTDKVVKKNISLATISVANQYYTGKAVKPAPTVKYNDITTLQNGYDYTVTYSNNVKVGTAKVTIKGIGNYTGTVTKTFKITKLAKVIGAKLGGRAADALRLNWTKNTSADGYIVEMYKDGKWVRAAKITNKNTTTFRKAGLKASTVYKFRVRAYKMIGSVAAYSDYTATITARTNPSIVKSVKIAGKAKNALRLSWTKNTSAQGYIVEMYKGGKWVRVAKITNNSTTTFRKAGLAKNTTYKFRVCAYYMSGSTALYGNYGSVSGKTTAK